jgi:hypothetical protein
MKDKTRDANIADNGVRTLIYGLLRLVSDMLQLSPAETIVFQKSTSNELTGNVHILNVSKTAVTYKVRSRPGQSIMIINQH